MVNTMSASQNSIVIWQKPTLDFRAEAQPQCLATSLRLYLLQ